ncbi:MAG: DUF2306 domain-containing protein [Caulobacteraceae bacterium]|nr:MAG: DUF2306 domain-containing protein [Caulobacteraceae bacterium]
MRWPGRLWWGLAGLLSLLVAGFSYRYLAGVGPLAPNVLANGYSKPWLVVHVAGAATALLIGSVQFIGPLRRRLPAAHRWTGRVYAVACLVGGAGGLMLSFGSTAGPVAAVGFGILAVLWLATTTLGWRTALVRDLVAHRRWMIRSWALTLAAVTLRLYMVSIPLVPADPALTYAAIAWLCWVPNLVAAELYLRRT